MDQAQSREWLTGSFILATILHLRGHWWFIDNRKDLGWLEGMPGSTRNWSSSVVSQLVLMRVLNFLLLVLTTVAAMVFGGVHGHGNTPEICATQQLGQHAKLRIPEFNGKWQAYLRRLSLPATSEVKMVVAVHNERDTLSPWIPAKEIIQAIDSSRVWEDASPVRVVSFIKEKNRKDKCAHQYWIR
eukprot:6461288-Amphidinium_carterae.1